MVPQYLFLEELFWGFLALRENAAAGASHVNYCGRVYPYKSERTIAKRLVCLTPHTQQKLLTTHHHRRTKKWHTSTSCPSVVPQQQILWRFRFARTPRKAGCLLIVAQYNTKLRRPPLKKKDVGTGSTTIGGGVIGRCTDRKTNMRARQGEMGKGEPHST